MKGRAWLVLGVLVSGLALPGAAEACGGGGVVSSRPGSVGANAQRVVLSVWGDGGSGGTPTRTEVVVQIGVPSTTEDYGALLPVPSEPTLDPTPISGDEFDQLDEATAPKILTFEGGESSGSGCGCLGGSVAGDSRGAGVQASEPVNIGPVTAVVLSGGAESVSTWLGENGFAVAAANQALIEEYAGGYFIAIRRNEGAADGGATSIGLHFTMAGDHRLLPLRFSSLGAASTVAFTVFIATRETAGPSAPFAALTLDDLDPDLLRVGYASAVRSAVREHGDKAFVIEASIPIAELHSLSGTRLRSILGGSTLTRLSTVLDAAALTEDAEFYTPYQGSVPSERHVRSSVFAGARQASAGSLAALLLAGVRRRRRPTTYGTRRSTGRFDRSGA